MQYGLRCGKLEGRHAEVAEYQSILVKVTLCIEGGEVVVESSMVAWKTAWLTLTASCNSSTENFWPSALGRSVASFTSASFNGRQSPRGRRKVSMSSKRALVELIEDTLGLACQVPQLT